MLSIWSRLCRNKNLVKWLRKFKSFQRLWNALEGKCFDDFNVYCTRRLWERRLILGCDRVESWPAFLVCCDPLNVLLRVLLSLLLLLILWQHCLDWKHIVEDHQRQSSLMQIKPIYMCKVSKVTYWVVSGDVLSTFQYCVFVKNHCFCIKGW